MVWLSTVAILAGAFFALTQKNLKRMLAYILVSEIGYMVGGVWLGNALGMTGAILHIVNDALMTLCVFLAAGNLSYRLHGLNLEDLRGVFRKMPVTMMGLVAGGLSMVGIPPSCGFFSKWYLLTGAMEAQYYGFMAALILSSLINAVLFFRVIEVGYFEGEDHGPKGATQKEMGLQDAPFSMLVPLLLVATSLVLVGIYTGDIVGLVIAPVIPAGIR
jgi:multicomponent Na+:H+ antiporter subunit D